MLSSKSKFQVDFYKDSKLLSSQIQKKVTIHCNQISLKLRSSNIQGFSSIVFGQIKVKPEIRPEREILAMQRNSSICHRYSVIDAKQKQKKKSLSQHEQEEQIDNLVEFYHQQLNVNHI